MISPRKILIIKFRSLGDSVIMTCSLEQVKRAFPNAEIHVAVTSPWAPLFEGHPAVSRVWSYERRSDAASRAKTVARMAFKLRREAFDCVINFHASPSSSMLALSTGAKTRSVHFHGHVAKNRYSTVDIPGKGVVKPAIERDLDACRAVGVGVDDSEKIPKIYLRSDEKQWAKNFLEILGVKGPVLGLGLGSSRPTKCWPVEYFLEVAENWSLKGGTVLVIAGPQDESVISELTRLKPVGWFKENRILILDILKIRELAALLSCMDLFVGNDSGPKHLAISVGTRTVTLLGPEHPYEWHPYNQERDPYFFIEGLDCRKDALPGYPDWCGLRECIEFKHRCMRDIKPNQVQSKIDKMVKQ